MPRSSTPRPRIARPVRADAARNREKLLEAAGAAFDKHGTQASLEDIAKHAGVGIGTLYRHFPSREALIEALLREQLDALLKLADDLSGHASAGQALAIWLKAALRNSCTYRGLAGPIVSATSAHCTSSLRTPCSRMREAAAMLLARAQQAGEVRADVTAPDLMTMVNAIAWSAEQSPSCPARAERLLDIILDGLRVTKPRRGKSPSQSAVRSAQASGSQPR